MNKAIAPFFFFILIGLKSIGQGTTQIEILNADVFNFEKVGNVELKKLVGNCGFKQDDIYLYCDSAILNSQDNTVDAYGHVHIIQGDTLNIYSDKLNYNGNEKKARLYNNIRVLDGKSTLKTEYLIYDTKERVGNYPNGGELSDGENVLTSKIGYYFAKTHDAFFKKEVVLTNPDYVMKSDSLRYNTQSKISYISGPTTIKSKDDFIYSEKGSYDTKEDIAKGEKNTYYVSGSKMFSGDVLVYDRKKQIGIATGNIHFIDTAEKIILGGEKGYFDKGKDYTYVTDRSLLSIIDSQDTLFLSADTLKTWIDTNKSRVLYAYHRVKMFKKDLQASCDSLAYTFVDSTMRCFINPLIWSDKTQLSGEFVTLQIKNKKLDQMNLYNSALIVSENDSVKFNQIKGKNMFGYFEEGKLVRLSVVGNGESVYYAKEDSGDYIGANKTICSNMEITFKDQKVHKVAFIKAPEAVFYPLDQFPVEEQKLKGFIWKPEMRPKKKEDIFSQ